MNEPEPIDLTFFLQHPIRAIGYFLVGVGVFGGLLSGIMGLGYLFGVLFRAIGGSITTSSPGLPMYALLGILGLVLGLLFVKVALLILYGTVLVGGVVIELFVLWHQGRGSE